VTTLKNAMERILSSFVALVFASGVQAATLTVNVHNKSGDKLATAQTFVALHSDNLGAVPNVNGAVHRIEQIDAQFKPFISAVQKGSSIKFPNRDSFAHHVYSFSEPAKFQSELYSQQESHEIEVTQPGVIVVGCNIHDWMLAYVYVVDTPLFAQAKNNQVRFDNLAPGRYSLSYWHPSMPSPVSREVEIENTSKTVTLNVDLKRLEQIQSPSHSFHEDDDY